MEMLYKISRFSGRKSDDILQRNRRMHAYLWGDTAAQGRWLNTYVTVTYRLSFQLALKTNKRLLLHAARDGTVPLHRVTKTFVSKTCTSYWMSFIFTRLYNSFVNLKKIQTHDLTVVPEKISAMLPAASSTPAPGGGRGCRAGPRSRGPAAGWGPDRPHGGAAAGVGVRGATRPQPPRPKCTAGQRGPSLLHGECAFWKHFPWLRL